MTAGTLGRGRDAARAACAGAETDRLLADLIGGAATDKFSGYRRVHKRLSTASDEGYLRADRLTPAAEAPCEDAGEQERLRRQYSVDPWGTAYWLLMERRDAGERVLAVYSFGPNRRRDGRYEDGELAAEDDIVRSTAWRPPGE